MVFKLHSLGLISGMVLVDGSFFLSFVALNFCRFIIFKYFKLSESFIFSCFFLYLSLLPFICTFFNTDSTNAICEIVILSIQQRTSMQHNGNCLTSLPWKAVLESSSNPVSEGWHFHIRWVEFHPMFHNVWSWQKLLGIQKTFRHSLMKWPAAFADVVSHFWFFISPPTIFFLPKILAEQSS